MEHYSQQTSRRKTICITDVLIHGNVCDLSTKADEDPKIKMCMPAPGSQMLASSSSQQGTHSANRSDSVSSDPFTWGALEKVQIWESGTGGRMKKCTNSPAFSSISRGRCCQCWWVPGMSRVWTGSLSPEPVLERHGTNETWQSEVSRFWNTSDLCICQNHFSDFFLKMRVLWKPGFSCLGRRVSDLSGEWRCRPAHPEKQPLYSSTNRTSSVSWENVSCPESAICSNEEGDLQAPGSCVIKTLQEIWCKVPLVRHTEEVNQVLYSMSITQTPEYTLLNQVNNQETQFWSKTELL